MDCEYVLVYWTGNGEGNKHQYKFHDPTPEQAVETARAIIKHHQVVSVRESPLAPARVTGELYRQMLELDGLELMRGAEEAPKETNPTLVDRHMMP